MAEFLRLRVLTPAALLLEVEAAWVQVQLADGGGLGIWPGHAPLLAETVAGPLRYADGQGKHRLELAAGILHIEQAGATILTLTVPGERESNHGRQTER